MAGSTESNPLLVVDLVIISVVVDVIDVCWFCTLLSGFKSSTEAVSSLATKLEDADLRVGDFDGFFFLMISDLLEADRERERDLDLFLRPLLLLLDGVLERSICTRE